MPMDLDQPEGDVAPLTPPEDEDESRLPGLRIVAILYAVLTGAAVFLVFVALISAPMQTRMFSGLLGAQAVYLYSAIAALLSMQWVWLRNSTLFAQSTGQLRPDEDVRHDRGARLVFFLLFLACACAFNSSFRGEWHFGLAMGHDQPQYYAYLHSWVFDHDLDFENELKAIPGVWDLMANAHPDRPVHNVAPIGSPFLWLPFYLAAIAVVHGVNAWTSAEWPTDGISAPFAVAAAFGSMALAFAGLLLTHSALRRYFSHRAAFFSVLLMAVGSPLMWYVIDQPLMSHAPSFFAGALVFFLWAGWRDSASYLRYGLIGAAIGLAMLVRPSHAALLLLPLIDWGIQTVRTARGELEKDPETTNDLPPFARTGIQLGLILGAMLVIFSGQLFTWYFRYGFNLPEGSPMNFLRPNIVAVLFSAQHGLFAWHPVLYAGFLGVPLLWRKSRVLCVSTALVLLTYTYFNAAIEIWWAGGSFGMRRFVGTLAFVTPGIAAAGCLVVAFVRRRPTVLIWAIAAILIVWNVGLTVGIRQSYISFYQPKTFENVWQSVASIAHDRIGNPGSYPANLWFAARNGVSPGRYDLLSGFRQESFLGITPPDAEVETFDIADLKPLRGIPVRNFLGRGWYDTLPDSIRKNGAWCAYSKEPALLLPMRKEWSYTMELGLRTPDHFQQSQFAKFRLNGKEISGVVELPVGEDTVLRIDIPEDATRDGVNTFALEFRYEHPFPDRNVRTVWPGTGLLFDTWKTHMETIYLLGFKVVPK